MNGMMYIRGSRKDYDSWAAAGNEGWSYEEVLPYFLKSEDNKQLKEMDQGYHATGGPLTVAQFPYHPPLSYSLVKAGEELGEFHIMCFGLPCIEALKRKRQLKEQGQLLVNKNLTLLSAPL